ncbi:MAG: PTS sugar transporter subunit IIA [Sebaldella sp.]|nr:PTS sugar transporter subunit IIA [Sebaldella sp.]
MISEENSKNEHLEILIKLSKSILDDEFREKLEVTNSEIEVLELLKKYTA